MREADLGSQSADTIKLNFRSQLKWRVAQFGQYPAADNGRFRREQSSGGVVLFVDTGNLGRLFTP
jgi:hypothetical protein